VVEYERIWKIPVRYEEVAVSVGTAPDAKPRAMCRACFAKDREEVEVRVVTSADVGRNTRIIIHFSV
jgi:hypothetical protein